MSEDPPTWPVTSYCVISVITLPIYILVLVCLLRLRLTSKNYNTTFYTLLLQHCIADLLSMAMFITLNLGRFVYFIRQFYFNYQEYYIAAAAYNHIYFTLYIRCTGIILLSFQRYFAIVHTSTTVAKKIQKASKLKIMAVYWILPVLISLVVLKNTDFYYGSIEKMETIADHSVIQRNTLMSLIVVGSTCILCIVAYGGFLLFIRKNSKYLPTSSRREISLAAQIFVLLLSFFGILVFDCFQNYFSQTHNTERIFYMRRIYPLLNGILSYINPYCILFLNRDLSKEIIRMVFCKKAKQIESQHSVFGLPINLHKQISCRLN
ncbi:hypothetical protein CRE_27626 [Caenorhabditis remanei]|uniref:G-protein coupled receptors family 1 profile domain-containing protein n=1 Tax=Caenorhabditis remanei TaxID=31234 RepID=E3MKK9_CAERE|nr:hypothetical protein CRE_27626 [Caenorhabditis remanei]